MISWNWLQPEDILIGSTYAYVLLVQDLMGVDLYSLGTYGVCSCIC